MLMSCQEPTTNCMSEKIASSYIIGQACSHCLSWQWRIITSCDLQLWFNQYSLGLETFRLHYTEYCTKVTPCHCFLLLRIRCCCCCHYYYYVQDRLATLSTAHLCSCPLIEEALKTETRHWRQVPCWTVMAPYAINNSSTLLNLPSSVSAENGTLDGIALVPLGGNQNKDSDMLVTNIPYSLGTPAPTVGSGAATTTTVARIEEEEERTATGIPISLIWMPYVAFTLVILGLMIASFYKYHKKHGHKYVRRREELAKKHQQALNQMNLQAAAGGTVQNQVGHHPPGVREGGGGGGEGRGRDRDRDRRHGGGGGTLPPNGGPSSIEDGSSSRYRNHNQAHPKHSRSSGSKSPHKAPSKQRSNTSGGTPNKTSSSSGTGRTTNGKGQTKNNKRHKPLTFTKNENGSMVDLRVEEKDKGGSTKMFKTPFYTHKPLSPWTVPRPGEYSTLPTTMPSPTSPLAFSDDDDDHSYLIHQTKL